MSPTIGSFVALFFRQVGTQNGVVQGVQVDGQRVVALVVKPHLAKQSTTAPLLFTNHNTVQFSSYVCSAPL